MDIKSRVHERHPCGWETACRPQGAPENTWPATVRDISLSGIGLVVERRFDPGTLLGLEVPDITASVPNPLHVTIAHATALPGGAWLLGCAFAKPMTETQVQLLVHLGKSPPNARRQETTPERPVVWNAFVVDQVFAAMVGS